MLQSRITLRFKHIIIACELWGAFYNFGSILNEDDGDDDDSNGDNADDDDSHRSSDGSVPGQSRGV